MGIADIICFHNANVGGGGITVVVVDDDNDCGGAVIVSTEILAVVEVDDEEETAAPVLEYRGDGYLFRRDDGDNRCIDVAAIADVLVYDDDDDDNDDVDTVQFCHGFEESSTVWYRSARRICHDGHVGTNKDRRSTFCGGRGGGGESDGTV